MAISIIQTNMGEGLTHQSIKKTIHKLRILDELKNGEKRFISYSLYELEQKIKNDKIKN